MAAALIWRIDTLRREIVGVVALFGVAGAMRAMLAATAWRERNYRPRPLRMARRPDRLSAACWHGAAAGPRSNRAPYVAQRRDEGACQPARSREGVAASYNALVSRAEMAPAAASSSFGRAARGRSPDNGVDVMAGRIFSPRRRGRNQAWHRRGHLYVAEAQYVMAMPYTEALTRCQIEADSRLLHL